MKYLGCYLSNYREVFRRCKEKVSEFEISFGIAEAFGSIDRTHIPIKTISIISRLKARLRILTKPIDLKHAF